MAVKIASDYRVWNLTTTSMPKAESCAFASHFDRSSYLSMEFKLVDKVGKNERCKICNSYRHISKFINLQNHNFAIVRNPTQLMYHKNLAHKM